LYLLAKLNKSPGRILFKELRQMIYFIRSQEFVKIGYTDDLNVRLPQLQTGNPHSLELLLIHPGDIKVERELHSAFAEFHYSNEWFTLSEEIKEFIETSNKVFCSKWQNNLVDFSPNAQMKKLNDYIEFLQSELNHYKAQFDITGEVIQLNLLPARLQDYVKMVANGMTPNGQFTDKYGIGESSLTRANSILLGGEK
jgi:hypothetical protein